MPHPPEIFETPTLTLRRVRVGDCDAILEAYGADPAVTRYLVWRPYSADAQDQLNDFLVGLEARWDSGSEYAWVIAPSGEQRAIGMLAARRQGHKVDVGYVLARSYWGQGLMTEAMQALVAWCFANGVVRVWATCDLDNTASARVLEKCGFAREGILRAWLVHPNVSDEPRDCYAYALVK